MIVCGQLSAQKTYTSTFLIIAMTVDSAQFHWTTTSESGQLPFEVEQYLWGKWTKVGEVLGRGTNDTNKYAAPVHFHKGENLFRVIQRCEECGYGRVSLSAKYIAELPDVKYTIKTENIIFNRPVLYELRKGNEIIKTGYGNSIELTDVSAGEYILNCDTLTETITIK